MQVSLVPTEYANEVWPAIYGYMEQAAKYTHGRYTASDILDTVLLYDHQLWIAFNEDRAIKGAVITEIVQYPRVKNLAMHFCAGVEGLTWKEPMLKTLQKWAFDNGCDNIEASGRAGWMKIFNGDGYKPLWYTYQMPVADSGLGA